MFKLTNNALSYEKMGTKYTPGSLLGICQLVGMLVPLPIWDGTENSKIKLRLMKLPGFLQIKQRVKQIIRETPAKSHLTLTQLYVKNSRLYPCMYHSFGGHFKSTCKKYYSLSLSL